MSSSVGDEQLTAGGRWWLAHQLVAVAGGQELRPLGAGGNGQGTTLHRSRQESISVDGVCSRRNRSALAAAPAPAAAPRLECLGRVFRENN